MPRRPILSAPLLSLTLAFAASPLACGASAKDAEDRMLDRMSSEIDEAQSDTYRLAKNGDEPAVDPRGPSAGETSGAKQANPPPASPPPAGPPPTPTPLLPVVHLAPDGIEETGQGEQAPRLLLTNASLGRQPASHPPPRVSAAPEDAKHAYNAALVLVNAGRYAEAQGALTSFLIRWPDGPSAADALYARGQCDLACGDFASAAQAFAALLARFPSSRRAHDARLQLAVLTRRQGDASPAHGTYSGSSDRPAAPRQAAPQPMPPDARPPADDEDNEHIEPLDEDNEHLVGGDQR
jgi:TolA-binding protein